MLARYTRDEEAMVVSFDESETPRDAQDGSHCVEHFDTDLSSFPTATATFTSTPSPQQPNFQCKHHTPVQIAAPPAPTTFRATGSLALPQLSSSSSPQRDLDREIKNIGLLVQDERKGATCWWQRDTTAAFAAREHCVEDGDDFFLANPATIQNRASAAGFSLRPRPAARPASASMNYHEDESPRTPMNWKMRTPPPPPPFQATPTTTTTTTARGTSMSSWIRNTSVEASFSGFSLRPRPISRTATTTSTSETASLDRPDVESPSNLLLRKTATSPPPPPPLLHTATSPCCWRRTTSTTTTAAPASAVCAGVGSSWRQGLRRKLPFSPRMLHNQQVMDSSHLWKTPEDSHKKTVLISFSNLPPPPPFLEPRGHSGMDTSSPRPTDVGLCGPSKGGWMRSD